MAIVGESGSGKSVTALSIMKLIRSNSQLKISGNVNFEKKNLLNLNEFDLSLIRGKKISMIFQEPMTSQILYILFKNKLQNALKILRS